MSCRKKQATLEEILRAVETLTDELKVLVTAVDDLRCEVEWQIKVAADAKNFLGEVEYSEERPGSAMEAHAQAPTSLVVESEKRLSPSDALCQFEKSLLEVPWAKWQDDWADEDDAVLPEGQVIPVDVDTWNSLLDIRPAHVVGEGCCCEEGVGAPYLLAWASPAGHGLYLRELTEKEAVQLQALCLAAQAETQAIAEAKQAAFSSAATTQRDLF